MRKGLLALTALVSLAVVLAGCGEGGQDYGTEVTNSSPQPESLEDRIKRIENDPNMPKEAKERTIAGMRASGR